MYNLAELQEVFHDVFGDDSINLRDTTVAQDVIGWDSLMHVNLIIGIERRFKVKFANAEISRLQEEGQNVGKLWELICSKQGRPPL